MGRLDDRPQVAQRLELVGVDLATLELDSYRLRNGAHWRVGAGSAWGVLEALLWCFGRFLGSNKDNN